MSMDVTAGADAGLDLVATRRLPAPPAEVFAAWTEAGRVRQWWGPYGMTTPVCEIDLRPGGAFRSVMRDASGDEYPSEVIFQEIAPPEYLAVRIPPGKGGPLEGASALISFAPWGEGTLLTARWRHASVAGREAHEEMGFAAGWGQTLDRLAAHLANPALPAEAPDAARPQHGWLTRLLGHWECEGEVVMAPGEPPVRIAGTERVRMLGGFWAVAERQGECPGGGPAATMFTLGYDPRRECFLGTWLLSMTPHPWQYQGGLDAAALVLTLDTEGPDFARGGRLAKFQETIAFEGEDRRVVTTRVQDEQGALQPMLTMRCRRTG